MARSCSARVRARLTSVKAQPGNPATLAPQSTLVLDVMLIEPGDLTDRL